MWLSGKESTFNARDVGSIPGSGRYPGEGNGNPVFVFLPERSHGQKSLAGCSPWSCRRVGHKLATKQQKQQSMQGRLIWNGTAFSFYSKSNGKSPSSLHQRNGRMKSALCNPPWWLGGQWLGELQEYN